MPSFDVPSIPLPSEQPSSIDASTTSDAANAHDVPVQLDILSTEEDALNTRTEADAGDSDWSAPLPTDPIAFLLAPSTCHGRRLPPTTPGLELAERGMTLWHLCYKTPTHATSTHPLGGQQPERVTMEIAMSDGERLVLVAPVPPTATPWTISVLVALPPGVAPAFQGFNYYRDSRRLGIVASGDGRSFPTIQGEMRSWRVLYDQSQDEYIPARICLRPTLQNPDGAFFVPLDACIARSCPMIERLHCRDL